MWKKSPLGANFCMICGSSIFEVGTDSQTTHEETSLNLKNKTKSMGIKIPIMIGIPVLILIIIGGAYSQGFLITLLKDMILIILLKKKLSP